MSYDLFGSNFLNTGGCHSYGTNMVGPLYMMSFYDQLKNSFAGKSAKVTDTSGNTAGSSAANTATADFQTAFQEAFREALQKSMGIDSTDTSQTASGARKTASDAGPDRTVSARTTYQTMSSYGMHPSHVWTSSFARS